MKASDTANTTPDSPPPTAVELLKDIGDGLEYMAKQNKESIALLGKQVDQLGRIEARLEKIEQDAYISRRRLGWIAFPIILTVTMLLAWGSMLLILGSATR
jgi:hypothetical protein